MTIGVITTVVAAVPALTQQPSTRAVVVLSTAHLSGSTINLLDVTPVDRWPVAGGPIPFGYYIWAPEDADEDREIPSDLAKVLQWARAQAFDYVQFDADEDIRDDLPAFDHEDVMTRDQLAAAIQDRDAETITELRRQVDSLTRELKDLKSVSA